MAEKKESPVLLDLQGNPTTGITPLKGQKSPENVNFNIGDENEIKTQEATVENPVVDRGKSNSTVKDLELNEENFRNIFLKDKNDRTEQDERFLKNIQFERTKGRTIEDILGIQSINKNLESEANKLIDQSNVNKLVSDAQGKVFGENLIDDELITDSLVKKGFTESEARNIVDQRNALIQSNKDISDRQKITEERIKRRSDLIREQADREKQNIIKQTERLQNQTQRLRSLRGVGRSTATEGEILELERKGNNLIDAVNAQTELKIQEAIMIEEGAEAEALQGIRERLKSNQQLINQSLNESIQAQKQVDAQIGSDFDSSINNMLGILEAGGVDVGEFDKDATAALGYISDSKGNPLRLDENGKPLAPKNEFGQDVKISQFKDGNDNTYVYKNGQLDSVITNEGNILKGTQLQDLKVPAQVAEDKKIEQQRDVETQLRKEFISRPEVKRFQEIKAQFERVKQGANAGTAAGDLALIFSFMKMLDPASVVREGEFATAQNAAGVPDQIRNSYNKVQTGERLNSNQRNEFKTTAENLFIAEQDTLDGVKESFRGIIQDAGAREEFVILGEQDFQGTDLIQNDDISEIDSIFSDGQSNSSGSGQSFNVGGKTFKIDLQGLDNPDQTGSKKVQDILGNVNATVLPKGADNPVLGKSGGSLTFRTNNPLAITATSPNQLERIVNRFGARTDIFSPDSADNLVLNFNTWEEGLEAGKKLLEGKGNMNLSQLSESHTGTSAQGHKTRIQQKGLDLNRKYKDLSDDEKLLVVQAFTEAEGFTQGNDI